jgi:hypothetical protein
VTPVLRPRIETLRFRSEQRELAFPSVHPRRPGVFPEDTAVLRAAAPAESTTADMEGNEVRLNRYTSIARQTLPRLVLAGIVSALLAGCGSGTMNNSNLTGTVGSGSIVGVTPGGSTSSTVYVAWKPTPDQTVTGYQVYYGPTLDSATTLASDVAITSSGFDPQAPSVSYRTWEDLGLHTGDTVCFRLRAYNPDGVSDPTSGICTQV